MSFMASPGSRAADRTGSWAARCAPTSARNSRPDSGYRARASASSSSRAEVIISRSRVGTHEGDRRDVRHGEVHDVEELPDGEKQLTRAPFHSATQMRPSASTHSPSGSPVNDVTSGVQALVPARGHVVGRRPEGAGDAVREVEDRAVGRPAEAVGEVEPVAQDGGRAVGSDPPQGGRAVAVVGGEAAGEQASGGVDRGVVEPQLLGAVEQRRERPSSPVGRDVDDRVVRRDDEAAVVRRRRRTHRCRELETLRLVDAVVVRRPRAGRGPRRCRPTTRCPSRRPSEVLRPARAAPGSRR